MFLCFQKNLLFRTYLSSLQLVLSVCFAALKCLPFTVVRIIFAGPLGFRINETILGCFEYTALLKDLLEGVTSVEQTQ